MPLADRLGSNYAVKDRCLCQVITKGNANREDIYLLNGVVEAVSEVTKDNGQDVERCLNVVFHCANGKAFPAQISTKDIYNGNFQHAFGIDFRPAVGNTKLKYIADSVLAQADYTPRITIYQQTGWRQIGGKWVFLHSGGAIGAEGVTVELSGRSEQYYFPETASPQRWDTLKLFLNVAPKHIVYPLLAIVALSPLCEASRRAGHEPSFVMWLQGVTGSLKSTLAALALNWFGEDWNNKSLPASFKDTANYLEKQGFLLADVLTVIDDYYPATNRTEAAKMTTTAQAIARAWGDRVGRNRMNADTSLKRGYPARGMLLVTGEDAPAVGQSGAARNFVVEIKAGDVRLDVLSQIQANTRHLSEIMRGFIEWLAPQYEQFPQQLKERFLSLRTQAQSSNHGRTTEATAHLQIGIEMFSRFMADNGQLSQEQADALQADTWCVFGALAEEQTRRILQDKPTALFISALKELLDTKAYSVISMDAAYGIDGGMNTLGYKDENYYYLFPDTVYKAVRQFYNQADRNFPLTKNQLYRHLAIEGLIYPSDKQSTRQKKIKNKNGWYLWLYASALEVKVEPEHEDIEELLLDLPL